MTFLYQTSGPNREKDQCAAGLQLNQIGFDQIINLNVAKQLNPILLNCISAAHTSECSLAVNSKKRKSGPPYYQISCRNLLSKVVFGRRRRRRRCLEEVLGHVIARRDEPLNERSGRIKYPDFLHIDLAHHRFAPNVMSNNYFFVKYVY